MIFEKTHISEIEIAFERMQSKEDLLNLLNLAKPFVYGGKAAPFELRQLTWYSNPKINEARYLKFKILKKSGAHRTIHAPVKGLRAIQKTLAFILQCVFEPHKAAMGFVKGKSIVDNARLHEGSRYVYNIDLKDFFPSIDQARVWKCFQLEPFNLKGSMSKEEAVNQLLAKERIEVSSVHRKLKTQNNKPIYYNGAGQMFVPPVDNADLIILPFVIAEKSNNAKYYVIRQTFNTREEAMNEYFQLLERKVDSSSEGRMNLANILAAICCTEMEVERVTDNGAWELTKRNVLPQGAPTSPVITNVVCKKLDNRLSGVAKRFGLKYSRYVDDITFSSMHNVYQADSEFLKEMGRIISEQGFHIKESKTRLQKDGYRKEVTGLVVNEKANVQQRYIKQLRMWLYYWEEYGYEKACEWFLLKYFADKGHVKRNNPDLASVISGKLNYLKMVKGSKNELYLKLKRRNDALVSKTSPLNNLLDIWFKEGIEKAMEIYYSKPNLDGKE